MEQARGIMPAHVTLVEMASDDCWARDTGPVVIQRRRRVPPGWTGASTPGAATGGLYPVEPG